MSRTTDTFVKPISKFSMLFASLLIFSACSQTQFSPSAATAAPTSNQVNPPPPGCVPVTQQSRLLKIMFLVDTSGSNFENNTTTDGTDPDKKFRLGSIQNFFNRYSSKTSIQWGFTTFSSDTATDFIGTHGNNSFTSDVTAMQNALTQFSTLTDVGDTPYLSAINSVTSAINNDPDLHSTADPLYYVIFLSDGYPSDISGPSDIQSTIGRLLNTDVKNVILSSVFYGHKSDPQSGSAVSLLNSMAQMGGGQFADATDPKSIIDIDTLLTPPASQCPNP